MWTWTLAAALAAEPAVDSVDHAPPFMLSVDKRGHILVLDAQDEELDPREALLVAGLPEEAEAFSENRRQRKAGAWVLWSAGMGISLYGTERLLEWGNPAALVAGMAVHSSGYVLLYSSPKEQLNAWVDERELARRLGELAALADDDPVDRPPLVRKVSVWTINEQGLVETSDGSKVGVVDLARAAGDLHAEDRYVDWRRTQRRTWGGMMLGGGVVTVAGLVVAGLEIDEQTTSASLATSALGAGMTVGGLVGLEMANRPAHARRWLSPEQIERAVENHNGGGASLAPEPATTRWSLQPVVGPAYLGLSGTF